MPLCNLAQHLPRAQDGWGQVGIFPCPFYQASSRRTGCGCTPAVATSCKQPWTSGPAACAAAVKHMPQHCSCHGTGRACQRAPCTSGQARDAPCTSGHAGDAPCTYSQARDAPCTYSHARDAPCTAGQARDAPCTYSQARDAPCTAGHARDAPCTYSQARDAPCTAGQARDAPCTAGQARDAPCTAGQARDAPCTCELFTATLLSCVHCMSTWRHDAHS